VGHSQAKSHDKCKDYEIPVRGIHSFFHNLGILKAWLRSGVNCVKLFQTLNGKAQKNKIENNIKAEKIILSA